VVVVEARSKGARAILVMLHWTNQDQFNAVQHMILKKQ
jgi:hypothetical protein